MKEYIVGKITYTNDNYVILENSFIGYKIFVANPSSYEKNIYNRLYIYEKTYQSNKGNLITELYGFNNIYEKIFFELLITLNGIGTKTAINMLKTNVDTLKQLIIKKDFNTLETMPGFNKKIAWMVCNEISYKISLSNDKNNLENQNNYIPDLIAALKSLGYKKEEVEMALNHLNANNLLSKNLELNDLISESIKIIIGENENTSTKAS